MIAPLDELYASEPSPPASVTDTKPLTSASVLSVNENAPVPLLYDKSPLADTNPLIFASDKPASVSVPFASSYVEVMFVPPTTKPFTISSISSCVLPDTISFISSSLFFSTARYENRQYYI